MLLLLIIILNVLDNGYTLYKQYSYNTASVPTGASSTTVATLVLSFDTTTNTYTSSG
jgi:hypothetical protein